LYPRSRLVKPVSSPEIGNLPRLFWLNLSGNQLTSIPPEFGKLPRLVHLHLSGNQLTTLPPEIGNLPILAALHLENNQLTTLPPEIGNLTALEELNLSGNQLTTLPPEITQIKPIYSYENAKFKPIYLYFDENRLCNLPDTIIDWIDSYGSSNDWYETQKRDDTHYCDGTNNKTPAAQPKQGLTIHHSSFSDQVTFTFTDSHTADMVIYNTKGKQVKRFDGINNSASCRCAVWNTSGKEKGVYYLKAVIGSKNITRKFMLN